MSSGIDVIIPASGCSERCGNKVIPKQFCVVNRLPVIIHTILLFEGWESIDNIVVTLPDNEKLIKLLKTLVNEKIEHSVKITFCPGAVSRHLSILEGLKTLEGLSLHDDSSKRLTVIHDGVRPYLKKDDFDRLAKAAFENKASGFIRPLVSTVLSVDESDFLTDSLNRSKFWASETPQVFSQQLLLEAYKHCQSEHLVNGTECLKIVHDHDNTVRPKLIHGPDYLWKITYEKDFASAKQLLSGKRQFVYLLNSISESSHGIVDKIANADCFVVKKYQISVLSETLVNVICAVDQQSFFDNIFDQFEFSNCNKTAGSFAYSEGGYKDVMIIVINVSSVVHCFSNKKYFDDLTSKLKEQSFVIFYVLIENDIISDQHLSLIHSLVENPLEILCGQIFVL